MPNAPHQIAIVGAGICGLTLAVQLQESGLNSFVIEKSKSVGGRIATRRDGDLIYDHGAAFYTHSSEAPFLWHERWTKKGINKIWFQEKNKTYSCGNAGMTILAKDLAKDQKIHHNEKVLQLKVENRNVQILCESGKIYQAEKIILTSPLPQSLEILRNSALTYPSDLDNFHFAKAVVGLCEVKTQKESTLDFGILYPGSSIFSIANNKSKGISKGCAITFVMNAEWSDLHFDDSDEMNLKRLESELQAHFFEPLEIQKLQLKKWRYSHPMEKLKADFLAFQNDHIFLAGDAFGGGSVAGAVRSASKLHQFLLAKNENSFL